MLLRDALDIKKGTQQVNKIYKGTYKVWDRNKIALEGYCKQGDLPSEYQQVEYIESTGTQYIDTNVNADYKLSVLAEFSLTEFGNAFGAIGSASGLGNRHHFNFANSQGIRYYYTGTNVNTVQLFSPNEELGVKHKYFIDIYNSKVQIDDGTLENIDTRSEFDIGINYWLFRRNANSDSLKTYSKIKLYNFKMYKENILVRNFIPCYRKNDSVIGLYDTINNVFYTNDGTGIFGKGSNVPNPNCEQPIEVMQGRQIVTIKGTQYIVDLKSKNLFDKDNANIVNGWIYIATMRLSNYNGNRMFYIPCEPNTTYTISRSIITSSFRVATYDNTTFPTPTDSNVDYTISNYIENNDGTSITITTGANAKFLIVHYGKIEDTNMEQSLASIQVEKGSTATPFDPYYDYKLAGIGDYKDNFYTDKGKWYFKQNIGNVVLIGDTNELYTYQNNARFYLRREYFTDKTVPKNPTTNLMGVYCNRFVEQTRSNTWAGVEGISYDNPNTTLEPIGSSFDIACNSVATTAEAFKTWLSTHNLDLWYLLQNPQITEIPSTYTTLINQLNALYQAM